ncbi:MAG: TonB-dependent receptor [Saprospiraceae bacterium]|nr:TonB-dependent receptor [Saprospiraceae bacterium]
MNYNRSSSGRKCFVLLLLSMPFYLFSQNTFTLNGYVEDAASKEKLISAIIYDVASKQGVVTNTYGFFSLTLPKGEKTLTISFVGYETQELKINLIRDTTLNLPLKIAADLQAVEVSAKRQDRIEEQVQMSKITVPVAQIKKIPMLLGEVDVLKALQFLPGVQSGGEGQNALVVRGGSPDQNLIILDGVPVYNVSHLGGLFSVFNGDAIKNVSLTKGGFPARFGGRLSSVLEIDMKDGNMQEYHGEGGIGILTSRLMLEGPLVKNKASFMIAGRRTYYDVLIKPIAKKAFKKQEPNSDFDFNLFFYDLNAKVNWKINEKHRLFLSAFNNADIFNVDYKLADRNKPADYERTKGGIDFGNTTGALRWNWLIGKKLFANTTVAYTRYQFNTIAGYEIKQDTTLENANGKFFSGIKDWSSRIDLDYLPNPQHRIRFGASNTYHTYSPGAFNIKAKIDRFNTDTTLGSSNTFAHEPFVYVEDEISLGKFKANVGLHYGGIFTEGSWLGSLQPRMGVSYRLPQDIALKASFASMQQNVNLLTNEGVGLPTDLWTPSTKRIVPQKSWQIAAGAAKTWRDAYEISVEAYYKDMTNVLSLKEGASFLGTQNNWQDKVTQGDGKAYGLEFFLQKKEGKTTGWVSYTWSKNLRQFNDLNGGLEFPYKYDRRHDFKLIMSHLFSKRFSINAAWQYGTGNALTLYTNNFRLPSSNQPIDVRYKNDIEVATVGERNAYRLPAYHRLDMSLEWTKKKKRHTRTWVLGCYNVYGRANPFALFKASKFDQATQQSVPAYRILSLIPIPLPSISYNFKF